MLAPARGRLPGRRLSGVHRRRRPGADRAGRALRARRL